VSGADFKAWLEAYLASLDEEALLGHASAAMLAKARADAAAHGAGAVVELGPEAARVTLGENTVELDRGGLPGSRCSCPARGLVCRHRLSAALVLQGRLGRSEAGAPPGDRLAALDLEAVKAAFSPRLLARARAALGQGALVGLERGAGVRVHLRGGVRCELSPLVGLEASSCSCRRPFPCEHRAIAALALLADLGRLEPAAKVRRPRVLASGRSEAEVLAGVRAFVQEIVRVGLDASHAGWCGRAARLALMAHAVDLPSLERELLALAEQLELARQRSAACEPAAAGDQLARIDWRCRELGRTDGPASPFSRRALAGDHRRPYLEIGPTRLLCLGVEPFAAQDGLRGVILHFHGAGAFHELLLRSGGQEPARGGGAGLPVWNLGDHRALPGRELLLEGGRRSDDGRLSSSGQARAALLPPFDPLAAELGPDRVLDFGALAREAAALRRFTLEPGPRSLTRVVAPVSLAEVRLDPVTGWLTASLRDAGGRCLRLRAVPRPGLEGVVEQVRGELLTRPPRQILGRAWHEPGGPVLEPVACLHADEPRVVSLGLPSGPGRWPGAPAPAPGPEVEPPSPQGVLEALRVWQADVLCAGLGALSPGSLARVRGLAERLRASGRGPVARALLGGLSEPAAWLTAWAVAAVAQEVEAGLPPEP